MKEKLLLLEGSIFHWEEWYSPTKPTALSLKLPTQNSCTTKVKSFKSTGCFSVHRMDQNGSPKNIYGSEKSLPTLSSRVGEVFDPKFHLKECLLEVQYEIQNLIWENHLLKKIIHPWQQAKFSPKFMLKVYRYRLSSMVKPISSSKVHQRGPTILPETNSLTVRPWK